MDHQLQLLEIDPTSVEEPFLEQAAALKPELVAALVPDQAAHAEGSGRRCPQASRTSAAAARDAAMALCLIKGAGAEDAGGTLNKNRGSHKLPKPKRT